MKALSIQQPWAWCIVAGYKPVENRTWYSNYRGELHIHTGKKIDKEGYAYIKENFTDVPLPSIGSLETGGFIGKVKMTDCVKKFDSRWFFGIYGFVFEDPERYHFIPAKEQLGIWNVDFMKGMRDIINYGKEEGLFKKKIRRNNDK